MARIEREVYNLIRTTSGFTVPPSATVETRLAIHNLHESGKIRKYGVVRYGNKYVPLYEATS